MKNLLILDIYRYAKYNNKGKKEMNLQRRLGVATP